MSIRVSIVERGRPGGTSLPSERTILRSSLHGVTKSLSKIEVTFKKRVGRLSETSDAVFDRILVA